MKLLKKGEIFARSRFSQDIIGINKPNFPHQKRNTAMNKTTFIKLLLNLKKQSNVGISLTELLVALVMSSIILTAAASGFVNLLRANQDVESKTVRNAGLARALAFMQEDVKAASAVTFEAQSSGANSRCTPPTTATNGSDNCLLLEFPASYNTTLSASCTSTTIPPQVSYKFEDISSLTGQTFLKPAILTRRIICRDAGGTLVTFNPVEEVIADGLVGISTNNIQPTITCTRADVGLSGTGTAPTIYGTNNAGRGGFRFCLNDSNTSATPPNRLVRIFLSGYVGRNTPPLTVQTVTFARSQ
ncbi:PulJ/GspJ family protein [Geminocystis sp. CENA526]|uniref:PulJ/GspJ family protein n=1 Tax=Geminocystis sp. CENA526 TaxID=1355871 RepID=UPI003D6EF9E6